VDEELQMRMEQFHSIVLHNSDKIPGALQTPHRSNVALMNWSSGGQKNLDVMHNKSQKNLDVNGKSRA
jgi:hypothetical protein